MVMFHCRVAPIFMEALHTSIMNIQIGTFIPLISAFVMLWALCFSKSDMFTHS